MFEQSEFYSWKIDSCVVLDDIIYISKVHNEKFKVKRMQKAERKIAIHFQEKSNLLKAIGNEMFLQVNSEMKKS